MKKLYLFIFLFYSVYLVQGQTVLFINGADTSAPTLYTKNGLDVYVNGGITINQAGSPTGTSGNYIQNNGTIYIQKSGQSDFSNNVTGLSTFTAGQTTGTVTFAANNSTQNITGAGTVEFMNLTVNNTSSPKVNLGENVTVDGVLNLGGIVDVQSSNLMLLSSGTIAGAPFSSANMIQTDSTGQFKRGVVAGAGTDLFPIGDGSPAYSPVTINFVSNATTGTVGLNVKPLAHPQINNPNVAVDYLKRYWTFSDTGLTTYSYSGNFKYLSSDIVGTESLMELSRWANPWYQEASSSAGGDSLVTGNLLDQTLAPLTGDFTGRNVACITSAGTITALKDSICSGTAQSLSIVGNTASIQWQSSLTGTGFTSIPGADSTSYLSQPSQTTYYRTFASGSSCSDTSLPFKLVVNALPTPSTPTAVRDTICSSDSTQICASGSFSSYLWNTGATSSCIEATNAGGYWVNVTDLNGCSNTSGHANISVYPVSSVSIIRQGDTLSSFGAVAYQWYFNGNSIQGATSNAEVATQSGDYSVQITDVNGCNASSSDVLITVGITNLPANYQVEIYPNPASGIFNVHYTGAADINSHLAMYNIIGEKVVEETMNLRSGQTIPVNIASLAKGVYLVQVQSESISLTRKIVVQ